MLQQLSKFAHSHAGLERTLRLLQSCLKIGAAAEIGIDDELASRLSQTMSDVSVGK